MDRVANVSGIGQDSERHRLEESAPLLQVLNRDLESPGNVDQRNPLAGHLKQNRVVALRSNRERPAAASRGRVAGKVVFPRTAALFVQLRRLSGGHTLPPTDSEVFPGFPGFFPRFVTFAIVDAQSRPGQW